jgi:uncharacterized membrane protein
MYQNVLALCFALPYWLKTGSFNIVPLLYGGVAALFDNIGMQFHISALNEGPGGPVSAIITVSSVTTAVVQAIRYQRMLTHLEFVGIVLGMCGSLIIAVPEWFEKHFEYKCCCCC